MEYILDSVLSYLQQLHMNALIVGCVCIWQNIKIKKKKIVIAQVLFFSYFGVPFEGFTVTINCSHCR